MYFYFIYLIYNLNITYMNKLEPIQVIRVEHEDGIGIFNTITGKTIYDIKELHELIKRHFKFSSPQKFKNPSQDGLNLYKGCNDKRKVKCFCAFKSLHQFRKLITADEVKIILDHGFNIFLLTVTNYQCGEDQVIYTKKSIKSIKSKENINSLF